MFTHSHMMYSFAIQHKRNKKNHLGFTNVMMTQSVIEEEPFWLLWFTCQTCMQTASAQFLVGDRVNLNLNVMSCLYNGLNVPIVDQSRIVYLLAQVR